MSVWYNLNKDNTDIDTENESVDILLFTDHNGNVYLTITFDEIKEIYEEILKKEEK